MEFDFEHVKFTTKSNLTEDEIIDALRNKIPEGIYESYENQSLRNIAKAINAVMD